MLKFGPLIAHKAAAAPAAAEQPMALDEMVVRTAGRRMYMWRAVDHEGEILDMLVQRRRDARAALPNCWISFELGEGRYRRGIL